MICRVWRDAMVEADMKRSDILRYSVEEIWIFLTKLKFSLKFSLLSSKLHSPTEGPRSTPFFNISCFLFSLLLFTSLFICFLFSFLLFYPVFTSFSPFIFTFSLNFPSFISYSSWCPLSSDQHLDLKLTKHF